MPRVRSREQTGGNIEDPEPYRHEHSLGIIGTDCFICVLKNLGRGLSALRVICQDDLGSHHEKCRRYSFAGDIGDQQAQAVFVDKKEII